MTVHEGAPRGVRSGAEEDKREKLRQRMVGLPPKRGFLPLSKKKQLIGLKPKKI